MTKLTTATLGALALGMGAMAAPASASVVLGDTIECAQTSTGNFGCSPGSATVDGSTEFFAGNATNFLSFDFSTNSLVMTALAQQSLGGTVLEFTNLTNPFTVATLTGQSGIDGFDASDVSVTGGVFSINLIDTQLAEGASATFTFGGAAGAVPEPGTWAMMILGFFGLGLAMRREKAPKVSVSYA